MVRYFKYYEFILALKLKQLVNNFECRLPYTVLDIKGCLQFISFNKSFAQVYFTLK